MTWSSGRAALVEHETVFGVRRTARPEARAVVLMAAALEPCGPPGPRRVPRAAGIAPDDHRTADRAAGSQAVRDRVSR
ncbi:hypothetical protein [Rhodococcus sp. (in: high G+C Gram-positive bacteria)]|uniref:hypothetical protein n=1 Tax=Rhodococcus sp. TaxID=1831 RepID=UPI003BB18D82